MRNRLTNHPHWTDGRRGSLTSLLIDLKIDRMVRLRTERWYGADGQRRSHSRAGQQVSGTRRLLSLCLLLALVIVLMQQAADPRHVRHAFQALGVPLEETTLPIPSNLPQHDPRSGSTSAAASASSTDDRAHSAWQATCRDVVGRLLDPLSDSDITQLAGQWFSVRPDLAATQPAADVITAPSSEHSAPASKQPTLPAVQELAVQELLAQLVQETNQSTISEAEKVAWQANLRDFEAQWQVVVDMALGDSSQPLPPGTSVSPELEFTLTTYFDQRLMAMLRDATPWTQSETIPFWRLLQRGAQSRGGESPKRFPPPQYNRPPLAPSVQPSLVNTLQLAAAADALRGSLVRFSGSVRRVEFSQRVYPSFGLNQGYAILWLRGSDQAVQPVAVYTNDPQAHQLAQQLDPNSLDFPEIEVEAILAKRLAYAAESGVQVAPALFATRLIPREPPQAPLEALQPEKLWNQFLIAVLLACLLAGAILIPIYTQYRQRARHNHLHRPARRQAVQTGTEPEQAPPRKGRASGFVLFCMLIMSAGPFWLYTHADAQLVSTDMQTSAASDRSPLALLAQRSSVIPPWAETATSDPVLALYVESLQKVFDPLSAQQLVDYSTQRTGPFPDSVLKVLYATRRVGWKRAQSLAEAVPLSDPLQLQARQVSGWVRLATPVVLTEGQLNWFHGANQEQLYQLEVQIAGEESAAAGLDTPRADSELLTIYCERIPTLWLSSPQLRQPARFNVLSISTTHNPQTALCGLAEGPQWLLSANYPAQQLQAELQPRLPDHLFTLGEQGWDLMHLDTIAKHSQQRLSSEEADGFYSLLRIAGNEPRQFAKSDSAVVTASPLELLARAQENVGQAVHWPVRIVSAAVVDVVDAHHREQLGADSYVQYDGFVDIGNDRIRFQPAGSAGVATDLEFQGEFPVTIVSPRAISGLGTPTGAPGARSWSVGKYTQVHGRFYRLWSYQSELVRATGEQARQIAPLLIAARIEPRAAPVRHFSREVGWFGWALCAAILVILAGILWLVSSTQRRRAG
jgi:hypothetical protein